MDESLGNINGEQLVKAVYGAVYGPFDYAGVSEVAEFLNTSKQNVQNYRKRDFSFPPPVADLAMGPIWRLCHIRDWKRNKDGSAGK